VIPEGRMREESRVRERYERRLGLPAALYDPSSTATAFLVEDRFRALEHLLDTRVSRERLGQMEILDVGSGYGDDLARLQRLGASAERLHGIDLLESRVAAARQKWPDLDIRAGSAAGLPWRACAFDIVLQSTVFTSILDDAYQERVAREMVRVLKVDGMVLWYDFWVDNPSNPDVRGVPRRRIKTLFPGMASTFRRVTLAPPLARALVPRCPRVARALNAIPWLRTHYWAVLWWPEERA
jgi:SAM-dependent methyltransferase